MKIYSCFLILFLLTALAGCHFNEKFPSPLWFYSYSSISGVSRPHTALDVTDIPTPMKVYGNGLGLKKYDKLPVRRKACFFDEEDCHRTDTLLKGVFRRNKINWPSTEDQGKLFVSGIKQVEDFLR